MRFPSEYLAPEQKPWVRFVQDTLNRLENALPGLAQLIDTVAYPVNKAISLLTSSRLAVQAAETQITNSVLRTTSYNISTLSTSFATVYTESFTPPAWATRCTIRVGQRCRVLMRRTGFSDSTQDYYVTETRLLVNGVEMTRGTAGVSVDNQTYLSGTNDDGTFAGNIVVAIQLRGDTAPSWNIVSSGSSLRSNMYIIFQR